MVTTSEQVHAAGLYHPRDDLVLLPIDGEAVVYDPVTQQLHRLNPQSWLVWQLLDGAHDLATTAREIAEGLGVANDTVVDDVVVLVRKLWSNQLIEGSLQEVVPEPRAHDSDEDLESPDEVDDLSRHLDDYWSWMPITACVESVTRLGWGATDAIQVAGRGIGIRANDAQTMEQVRQLFQQYLVTDSEGALPNLSIRGSGPMEVGMGREFARLYAECTLVSRSHALQDVLAALVREVEVLTAVRDNNQPRLVGSAFLVKGKGVVLAPTIAWKMLAPLERRLGDADIQLFARLVTFKADSGTVERPATELRLDWEVLGDRCVDLQKSELQPLLGWLFHTGDPTGRDIPAGAAMLSGLTQVANRTEIGIEPTTAELLPLIERVPRQSMAVVGDTLIDQLAEFAL